MSTLNPPRQSKLSARGPGEILFPDPNVPQPCPFNPIVSSRPPRTLANMVHRFFCSLHYKTPALDVMISGLVQDVHTCQLLHPTKQIENHFYLCIRTQIGPLILPPAWLGMYVTKAHVCHQGDLGDCLDCLTYFSERFEDALPSTVP